MTYDYRVKKISNGWLVITDRPDELISKSKYFEHEFMAFSYIAELVAEELLAISKNGLDRAISMVISK